MDPESLQSIIGLIHIRHQAQRGTHILTHVYPDTALQPSSITAGNQSLNLKMGLISYNTPNKYFPGSSGVKNPPANAEDLALISGLGGSPGERNDNPP